MVAPIGRVQTILSGFPGAPGLITSYWNGAAVGVFTTADATTAVAAVQAFLTAVKAAFPAICSLQVQPTVEVMEATTGGLIGVVPATPVAAVVGTGAGTVLTAEGPLVQWITSDVAGRRLVRGRTFLVPSINTALTSGGVVVAGVQAAILSGGATYIATAGPSPVIWHRPVPFATGANGSAHEIVSVGAPATVAVLRSRRD
jgi:hypothetical protein